MTLLWFLSKHYRLWGRKAWKKAGDGWATRHGFRSIDVLFVADYGLTVFARTR